jgi:CO dehydrogenase maturation factor
MKAKDDLLGRLIAVCGKGGTGKTALIAMMTKILTQNNCYKILVIDADPAMCLPGVLGVKPTKTVGDIREEIIKQAAKFPEEEEKLKIVDELDYKILDALSEKRGFGLLVMGRPEATGCFCPVNILLRSAIETLSKGFDVTLVDGEAGIEQIHRQVIRNVDTALLLTDLSARGLETASLIKNIVDTKKFINYTQMGLIINRIRGDDGLAQQLADKSGLDLLGFIPEDENITNYDLAGKPLMQLPDDCSSIMAVERILERISLPSKRL